MNKSVLISALLFFMLFSCSSLISFSQAGKLKLDITITDTVKPYFLDILINKDKALLHKITVIESGSYMIKDIKEGSYNLEFFSFESRSRRLYIDSVIVINDSITSLKVVYPGPCKFNYPKDFVPVCPYHHSDKIVKIIYGYPTAKTMGKAKKGLIHLGGCMVTDCDPQYYCTIHRKEI